MGLTPEQSQDLAQRVQWQPQAIRDLVQEMAVQGKSFDEIDKAVREIIEQPRISIEAAADIWANVEDGTFQFDDGLAIMRQAAEQGL